MKYFIYGEKYPGFSFDRPSSGKYTEISDELWMSLLEGQSQGKEIRSTENGDPYLYEYKISEEQISESIKAQRDKLLAESDWVGLKDVKLPKERYTAWAEYRQKLRDITKQEGFPNNVVFPEKPE